MPSRELLSPAQRLPFTQLPDTMPERDLARYFRFTLDDLLVIKQHRKPANRLGFAVQIAYLRYPGRALAPGEAVPDYLLAYLGEQVRVPPSAFADYARPRDTTRREHLAEVQRHCGLRTFTARDYIDLAHELLPHARSTDNPLALITLLVEICRRRRLLLPAMLTLERLAWGVRARAAQQLYQTLTAGHLHQRQRLLALVKVPGPGRTIPLTWLRQPSGAPTPANFLKLIKRLEFIRALHLPPAAAQIHPNRRLQLAREGTRYSPQRLRYLTSPHREALFCSTRSPS